MGSGAQVLVWFFWEAGLCSWGQPQYMFVRPRGLVGTRAVGGLTEERLLVYVVGHGFY